LRDGAFLITSVNVAPRLAAAASASDVFAFGQLLGYILLKFARKSCIWGIVQRVHTGFITKFLGSTGNGSRSNSRFLP
jgi:hypothetical protein